MTTANTSSKTLKLPGPLRLPDIPDREPDEVTQFDQLTKTGNAHYLAQTWVIPRPRWSRPTVGSLPPLISTSAGHGIQT